MHIIRLRSAWEPVSDRPGSASGNRFERSFGRPTNLGSERVFLVVEPAPSGPVQLNGQPLPQDPPALSSPSPAFRREITASLNSRNLLCIASDSATFDHEVRLEIVE